MDLADDIDQVIATISYALTDFVENLTLSNGGGYGQVDDDGSYVVGMYSLSLGRAPDTGGYNFYRGCLQNQTKTRTQEANEIRCSPEGITRNGVGPCPI
jgi:hypothetical protein